MESKEAAEILIKILERNKLSAEEIEAVKKAIGVLSWTKLAESRIKNKKRKN